MRARSSACALSSSSTVGGCSSLLSLCMGPLCSLSLERSSSKYSASMSCCSSVSTIQNTVVSSLKSFLSFLSFFGLEREPGVQCLIPPRRPTSKTNSDSRKCDFARLPGPSADFSNYFKAFLSARVVKRLGVRYGHYTVHTTARNSLWVV